MRAGADEVVTPYGLTGRRLAVLAVQPSVLEVLDLLNLGSDIRLEEVAVQAGTHLDSLTIAEARASCAGVALTEQQWMRFIVDGPSAMSWDEASTGDWMAGFKMLDGRRWPTCAASGHEPPAADERVSGLIAWASKCVAAAGGVCFSDGHGRIR
jgi:hypothetical protein